MKSAWRIIRGLLAVSGGILMFGAVGTSDYYLIELGQAEPAYVWPYIFIGAAMMCPAIFSMFYTMYKESGEK